MAVRTLIASASARLGLGLLLAFGGFALIQVGCLNPRPDVQPSAALQDDIGNPDGQVPGAGADPGTLDPGAETPNYLGEEPSNTDDNDPGSGAPPANQSPPTTGGVTPDAGPDAGDAGP